MAFVIAFMNNKGGVGKTTLTVNLGATLTKVPNDKSRVLIIDMDPQGNASSYLLKASVDRSEEDRDKDLGALLKDPNTPIKDLIHVYQYYTEEKNPKKGTTQRAPRIDAEDEEDKNTQERYFAWHDVPNLHVLPAFEGLRFDFESDAFLASLDRELLKRAIQPILNDYDFILIDCPPSLNMLSQMGLMAADYVIMPIKPGEFEIIGMNAMLQVIEHFGEIHDHKLNYKVVMNQFRNNSKKHNEYLLMINEALGDILASNTLSLAEEITGSIKANLPVIFSNKSVVKKDFFSLAKDLVKDLNALKGMEKTHAQ